MADCEHLARTSAYFDGALAVADETDALAHVATCAECQALLGDAMAIDQALSTAPRRARRGQQWPRVVGIGVVLASAAAVVAWVAWPRHAAVHDDAVAIALPAERALESRFTGTRFAPHRPLAVMRGAATHESIALAALASLEARSERADLVAALAATGDLARAKEIAALLPDDAASASDRAALALANRDPEAALAAAYHALDLDPQLTAAWWNLGLAARAIGAPHLARSAFAHIIGRGEPGWSAEAAGLVQTLAGETSIEDGAPALDARGAAMVAGGAPLTPADVAAYPALARVHFMNAVRLATTRARLDELRPLAQAIGPAATAMIDRADLGAAAKFATRYQAVAAYTATPAEATRLLEDLRAAGHAADDLRAGTIVLAGQSTARVGELRAITEPWHDPWYDRLVAREQIHARFPDGDLRAAAPLAAALAACTDDGAIAVRCGQLAYDLAVLESTTGSEAKAEPSVADAVARFRRAMDVSYLYRAEALLADLHLLRGHTARARAELEELELAVGATDCDMTRYAKIVLASAALVDGDWASARASLPPPVAPAGCAIEPDPVGLEIAIDLARHSGAARDREIAEQWRAAAGDVLDRGPSILATARLAQGKDPEATRALTAWLAAVKRPMPRQLADIHALGIATLAGDVGARGDWADVLAVVDRDGVTKPTGCALAASADGERITIAVRTAAGVAGTQASVPRAAQASATLVAPVLVQQLTSCAEIAVIATPPLHGRSDLLPPELAWWFVGDHPARAVVPAAPRRSLEVADAHPPDPDLPALDARSSVTFDAVIAGTGATPAHVLAGLATVTYAELHVHGVGATGDDAYLALSPAADGTYALRADAVRAARFAAAPVVVLAACRAAAVAPYLRGRFSLPDAFLAAGARAVVAADVAIPDADARRVFDELHRRLDAGEPIAHALAAIRAAEATTWVRHLVLFE